MPEGGTPDPIDWLKRLAESATRIRLAPGVIGKSSYINIGLVALWAIVLFRLSPTKYVLDALLIVGALVATWWGRRECRLMRDYAVANPHLALMEGADITEYKRFEQEAKGIGRIPPTDLMPDPTQPLPSSSGPTLIEPEKNA